jgi:hypothetical protein
MGKKPKPQTNGDDMGQPFPTRMKIIHAKVKAYHKKMNAIADFLATAPGVPEELKIDKKQEFIGFYIDKTALARLHLISTLDKCDSLAVYFGLADQKKNSVTGCFVAIDKDRKIVDGHFEEKVDNAMDGEDTWIPPGGDTPETRYTLTPNDLTLAISAIDLDRHFTR